MTSDMPTTPVPRDRAALIRARLDRLPTTRYIWKLLLLLSLGGCFEFYDLFLMTYIGPGLVRSGFFSAASASFFGLTGLAAFVSSTFAGLFIGTLVFGFAADRFGRRAIFTYSLLCYTAGSIVMAFQTTATGILAWRLITGIGIGVELVTIDTYIAELMPKDVRGRAFAINQVVQFSAIPCVAFVCWLLVPRSPFGLDGWRWVVLLGSAGAMVVWFIRRSIPESPRWLLARGRIDEAERVVSMMETRVTAEIGSPLPSPAFESAGATSSNPRPSFLQIFRPPYLRRTLMLMIFHFAQTVGYYGFASWVPTLLIAAGIRTTASLQYSFIIAISAPLGPLLVHRIADDFERKWQIVWSAACVGTFGLLFAGQKHAGWLILLGVLLTCANNWMSVAFHAYQAELFPTPVRAQAVGFVYSWSRFSAIFTSLMIGFFLARFGVHGVFAFIAASMLVVVLAIGTFGPRTRGLALESISR
ncbi:MAG TPA: MFS transporter [Candidatus Baltobacteraceae bacterium]|nr:MFS transporter [Candidatus Baltobacteraceae bacterium]